MQDVRRQVVMALVIVLAIGATAAVAGPLPSAWETSKSILVLKPAPLKGKVVFSDRTTPAAKVPVRVWSVEHKKLVHETTTDAAGAYTLPKLREGRYILVYADRVRVDLVVDQAKGRDALPLNIIVPRGRSFISKKMLAAELARAGGAGGSSLKPVLMGVAAGGAAWGIYEMSNDKNTGGRSTTTRTRRRIVSP